MKKLIIVSFLMLIINKVFGQESDSSFFFKYNHLEFVDSVFYQKQFYPNRKIKHKGWVIIASLKETQKLGNIRGIKGEITPFEQNVGIHNYFNEDGSKMKDIIIPSDLISGTEEKIYDKKGLLKKRVFYIEKKDLTFDKKDVKDKETKDKSNMELMKFEFYLKGKLWYTEEYDSNMKKNGCWKVYNKNESIKSEKYYQNGELISKKCPEK